MASQQLRAHLVPEFNLFTLLSIYNLFVGQEGMPHGLWDLSSRPGIEPRLLAVEVKSPNHWAAREVPPNLDFFFKIKRNSWRSLDSENYDEPSISWYSLLSLITAAKLSIFSL